MNTIDICTTYETIACIYCSGTFAVPSRVRYTLHESGKSFWCPYCGRTMVYKESEASILKKQLDQEFHRRTMAEDDAKYQERERRIVERRLQAQKGATTRIKRRVAAGVCPCCKRHFENLHRHMSGQHPSYAQE